MNWRFAPLSEEPAPGCCACWRSRAPASQSSARPRASSSRTGDSASSRTSCRRFSLPSPIRSSTRAPSCLRSSSPPSPRRRSASFPRGGCRERTRAAACASATGSRAHRGAAARRWSRWRSQSAARSSSAPASWAEACSRCCRRISASSAHRIVATFDLPTLVVKGPNGPRADRAGARGFHPRAPARDPRGARRARGRGRLGAAVCVADAGCGVVRGQRHEGRGLRNLVRVLPLDGDPATGRPRPDGRRELRGGAGRGHQRVGRACHLRRPP